MVKKKSLSGRATAYPVGIGIGLIFGLGITLICSAILAWLVEAEVIAEEGIGYGAMLILFLSSACGAWMAWMRIQRQRVQVCLIQAAAYYCSLLGCTALFFGGQYQGMGVSAVTVLLGSLTAVVPVFWKGKIHKSMAIKTRYR